MYPRINTAVPRITSPRGSGSPTIPQWLLSRPSSRGVLTGPRIKLLFLALLCLGLAYTVVNLYSVDDPVVDISATSEASYDNPASSNSQKIGLGTSYAGSPGDAELIDTTGSRNGKATNSTAASGGRSKRPGVHLSWGDKLTDKLNAWTSWRGSSGGTDESAKVSDTVFSDHVNSSDVRGVAYEVHDPGAKGLGEGSVRRVAKCTILFGARNPIYERALQTHMAHNQAHGYPLHVLRTSMLDDVWSKPAYILHLLLAELAKPAELRLEWLLWVDADTIILNPLIPIELFLPPLGEWDDVHVMVTNDWNGLNNGVFPIRVSTWSVTLFSAIVAFRHYRPTQQLTFRDQSAMDLLIQDEGFREGVVYAPQRWFNGYQGEHNETLAPHQVRRGDFLVHFAGVGNREERMRYWLERAESHDPSWEVDVKHTTYPMEVKEFWAGERSRKADRDRDSMAVRNELDELIQKTTNRLDEFSPKLEKNVAEDIQKNIDGAKAVLEDPKNRTKPGKLKQTLERLRNVGAHVSSVAEPGGLQYLLGVCLRWKNAC